MISETVNRLKEKIERNYQEYRAKWLSMTQEQLIDNTEEIEAVTRMAKDLPNNVTEKEAVYLLRFKNPLEIVSGHWISRNGMDALIVDDEMSHILYSIIDEESADEDYELEEETAEIETVKLPAAISLSDFIDKVKSMIDSEDKTAALDWIELAGFMTDSDEEGARTLEEELYEVYLPLCYVRNNFDNSVLQQSLEMDTVGNEIIFGAMLFQAGYTEAEIREMASEGAIQDGYIPLTEDEKSSLSLLLVSGEDSALYMSRRPEMDMLNYVKGIDKIRTDIMGELNQALSEPALGGVAIRRISHSALIDAVKNTFAHTAAFENLTVYNPELHTVRQYPAGVIPEELEDFIQQNRTSDPAEDESAGFTMSM